MSRKRYLKVEFERTFYNPMMYGALCIGMFLVILNLILNKDVLPYITSVVEGQVTYPLSAFEWRMAARTFTMPYEIFGLIFPLLAAIPFGCSLYYDQRYGWLKNLLVRLELKDYLKVKRRCLFMGGGVAVTLPLIIDFLINGCLYPAIVPDAVGGPGSVFAPTLWSEMFFKSPYLYLLLFLLVDFIFGGLYSLLAGYMGTVLSNPFAVYATPFLLHILIGYAMEILDKRGYIPSGLLMATQKAAPVTIWGFIAYAVLLIVIIFILHKRCLKHEKIL